MRAMPAWVLALLLLPGGAAGASTLSLESAAPFEVDGVLDVAMPASSLLLYDDAGTGVREVRGVTGVVRIWTWQEAHARPHPLVEAREQAGHATAETFQVSNATLRFVLTGAPFEMVVALGDEGEAAVSGALRAAGLPQRMARAAEEALGPPGWAHPPDPVRRPEEVSWGYAAGWRYAGNALMLHEDALPPPEDGQARFEGPLRLQASSGRVHFRTAEGREVHRDLGMLSETGAMRTWSHLVLDASAARADLPLPTLWQLAGPSETWTLEGRATWRHATGSVSSDGGFRRFEDATVETRGRILLTPEAPLVHTAADPTRYEGAGGFAAQVDDAPVRAAHASSPATPAAAASLLAVGLVALLAWKCAGFFFTRLAPGDVLLHPRRRALHDAVRESPGERLRDLQRRLGMAWGSFSFHLHVLVKGGHLTLRKEGAYTLVLPAAPPEGALIPHPTTRAVYDLLPMDGAAVPFPELRARLGYSRQRVNHHLQALESRGLVDIRRGADGARHVARRGAAPAISSASA